MFQGCFLYNKKGLCHVQDPKTIEEKKERKADLDTQNTFIEKAYKAKQTKDYNKQIRDYIKDYRRRPSRKQRKQVYNKANSAIVYKLGRGGINQY